MFSQTDRKVDKQTDNRQTDIYIYTNRQTNRQTDIQSDRQIDESQIDIQDKNCQTHLFCFFQLKK